MNISKRKVIAIFLILFAFVFGTSTRTGFSLGDKLFLALGISPWSNGRTGFHWPALVTFTLLIIGIMVAQKVMTGRQIFVSVIVLSMISPATLSLVKPIYYKMHSGLAAIEYDSRNTHISYRSEDDQNIKMIGAISFINYEDKPIKLGIKLSSEDIGNWLSEDLTLTSLEDNTMERGNFILPPGEQMILIYTDIPMAKDTSMASGYMRGPDLILFTEEETRLVGSNL